MHRRDPARECSTRSSVEIWTLPTGIGLTQVHRLPWTVVPEPHLRVRPATSSDVPAIYRLLRESAIAQHAEDHLCVTPDDLLKDGFGAAKRFDCLMAEADGKVAGIAVYFMIYSTWITRRVLYLEDLYVTPEVRRRGVARALMSELARVAEKSGCGQIRWLVSRDNTVAVRFYESIGAEQGAGWVPMSMEAPFTIA